MTVSIARRLQDPLAELIKIDPKNIGVGMYQVISLSDNSMVVILCLGVYFLPLLLLLLLHSCFKLND